MSNRTHRWMPLMNTKKSGPHKRANSDEFTTNILKKAQEMQPNPCAFIRPRFEESFYFEKNRKNILNEEVNLKLEKDKTIQKNLNYDSERSKFFQNFVSEKDKNEQHKHFNYEKGFIQQKNKDATPINTLHGKVTGDNIEKLNSKVRRKESIDSIYSIETESLQNQSRSIKKSECIVLGDAKQFSTCMNLEARAYIISEDKENVDNMLEILDSFKNNIPDSEWTSFRIVFFDNNIDVKHHLLSEYVNDEVIVGKCSDDFSDAESQASIHSTSTANSHASTGEVDKRIKYTAERKYRDSCIIAHKRLPSDTIVDPISKCFEKLTKLIEDEIFSVHNHVTAHVQELDILIKEGTVVKTLSTSE